MSDSREIEQPIVKQQKVEATRSKSEGHECQRCGLCCLLFGEMFWIHGEFRGCFDLEISAQALIYFDGFGSAKKVCEFLELVEGKPTCWIEHDYGYNRKPKLCREYPKKGQKCFREQLDEIKTEATEFFKSHRGGDIEDKPKQLPSVGD